MSLWPELGLSVSVVSATGVSDAGADAAVMRAAEPAARCRRTAVGRRRGAAAFLRAVLRRAATAFFAAGLRAAFLVALFFFTAFLVVRATDLPAFFFRPLAPERLVLCFDFAAMWTSLVRPLTLLPRAAAVNRKRGFHSSPCSANDRQRPSPTMRWSSTRMSTSASASFSR